MILISEGIALIKDNSCVNKINCILANSTELDFQQEQERS